MTCFQMDRGCRPVDVWQNAIILRAEVLLPSATTRLSLSLAFILYGAAGGVKQGTRVIFIPGLTLIVWIPRSINSLKAVNRENAT